MNKLRTNKTVLKGFGLTMGKIFLGISVLFLFKQKPDAGRIILSISCIFFIAGIVFPVLLRPIYIVWMRLALALSWVNSRIILIILFYLIFTPLSLLLRIFKIDLLEKNNKGKTYWKKKEKEEFSISNYERRF